MTIQTAGPTAGPPGDPAVLAGTADRFGRLAGDLAAAGRITAGAGAEGGWSGAAATAFWSGLAVQGDRIAALAQASAGVAGALRRYAAELDALQQEWTRARVGDPAVLAETAERLRAAAGAAARRAAAAVDGATTAVPPPLPPLAGEFQRWRQWEAELGLGTDESIGQFALAAARFRLGRLKSDPIGFAEDAGHQLTGLAGAARHPRHFAAQVLDLDTWRTSPLRAVGHLVPDLVAAAVSGGTSAAGRRMAATAARAGRAAELKPAAQAARLELVDTATARARPVARGWSGHGLTLDPEIAARVASYHRMVAGCEAAVTDRMRGLAGRIGARLEGLEHRVKELPSLNRKMAERVAQKGSGPQIVRRLLEQQGDTLRYTMVLPHRGYTAAVRRAALELDRAGYVQSHVKNYWREARYHGLNTNWTDLVTGVQFEVQFHTPRTWLATVRTHPWYEEWRLPETAPELKAELDARIGAEYAAAGTPRRVDVLTEGTLPPPEPVALPVLPAAGAAAGTAVATAAARRSGRPEPQ